MACHNLDPVQPGLVHPARSTGIACHDLFNQRHGQGAGHYMKALVGHGRGGIGHGQQTISTFHNLAPGVEKLREDGAAFGVNGLGQGSIARDAVIACGHQQMRGVARRFMHACHLRDNQPRPTLGPCAVVFHQCGIHRAIGGQSGVMPRRQDAVAQGHAPQCQWRKQMRKLRHDQAFQVCCLGLDQRAPFEKGPRRARHGQGIASVVH